MTIAHLSSQPHVLYTLWGATSHRSKIGSWPSSFSNFFLFGELQQKSISCSCLSLCQNSHVKQHLAISCRKSAVIQHYEQLICSLQPQNSKAETCFRSVYCLFLRHRVKQVRQTCFYSHGVTTPQRKCFSKCNNSCSDDSTCIDRKLAWVKSLFAHDAPRCRVHVSWYHWCNWCQLYKSAKSAGWSDDHVRVITHIQL